MADFLHVLAWNQLSVIPLAAAVWGVSRARLFRERPALRHGLWLLVLLKFVTPALIPAAFLPAVADERDLTSQVHREEAWATQDEGVTCAIPAVESAEPRESLTQSTSLPGDARHTSRNGPPIVSVLGLSLLVSFWLWVAAIRQVWRIRRLLSKSACESGRVVDAVQDVSRCFRLKKEPRLMLVDESISPMLWAESGRLAIVLPRSLAMSIDDAQLRHILAHEVAHFVRRDHWGNSLSFFVTSLFWWNPIAWLARRELRTAAESCCDAMAIDRMAGSRKSYAKTLLAVVDFVTSSKPFQPTVATTFGESRSLKRRIEMIANPDVKTSLSRSGLLLVVCGVVSLTLVPARAQQEAPDTSGPAAATPPQPSPGAGSRDPLGLTPRGASLTPESKERHSGQASEPPVPPGPWAALQKGIPTVLSELTDSKLRERGIHAEARRVHLRADPETRPVSMAIELSVSLIPANRSAAPLEWKSVGAFLEHWAKSVNARGVKMIVEQIKRAPADQGNDVDLEIVVRLHPPANAKSVNASPDRLPGFGAPGPGGTGAKAKSPPGIEVGSESDATKTGILLHNENDRLSSIGLAQIATIGGKISREQTKPKAAVQWKTSDGGNGHFYKVVAVPEAIDWAEARRRPIATGGNVVTIASKGIAWTEANRRAIAAGGHLVTITSKAENDFVFALVDHPEYWERMDKGAWMMGPWIGAVQAEGAREPDGGWQWATGEPFAFTNWIPGDPNNHCKASGAVNRICFYHGARRSRSGLWCDAAINSPYNVSYVIEFDRFGTGDGPKQPSRAISGNPKPATSKD